MNAFLAAVFAYADRGWRVFPLHGVVNGRCTCGRVDCSNPGKHPLVRRGLKEATSDVATIRDWWCQWRRANIGIATGERSGIVVIDVDLPRALPSLDALVHKLPRTLTGLTGGGGIHLLYRARLKPPSVGPAAATSGRGNLKSTSHQRLRSTCSRLPGIDGELPGIDLRADGGYIVAPPSRHVSGCRYEWLDPAADIGDAPAWLEEPPRPEIPAAPPSPPRFTTGDGTAYGRAVLERALTSLRCAPIGQRNQTLNRIAFSLAQLVAGGELLDTGVRSSLQSAALGIGLSEWESRQTIASAFDAGLRQPRVARHRMKGCG